VEKLQPVRRTFNDIIQLYHKKRPVNVVFWTHTIPLIIRELEIPVMKAYTYDNGLVEVISDDPVRAVLDLIESEYGGDIVWF
jgi:hypothetical protein